MTESGQISWPDLGDLPAVEPTPLAIAPSWSWASAQAETFYQFGRWVTAGPYAAQILHAVTTPAGLPLDVTRRTVETHLTHVFAKLEVKDRAAAVAVAYDRGILG